MPRPPPDTGYSGTPLAKKLGIKAGHRVRIVGAPPGYPTLLGALPAGVKLLRAGVGAVDVAQAFVKDRRALVAALARHKPQIQPDGALWISWPKRASGVATDLTEDVIRDAALAAGLVDVKVCAIDATWSGLKLVVPLRDR